jgi:hypothetical protein
MATECFTSEANFASHKNDILRYVYMEVVHSSWEGKVIPLALVSLLSYVCT